MKTYFVAVVLANMCFILKGQDLRFEPAHRPFWAKVSAPFELTCISDHTSEVDIEWVVEGGKPDFFGFKVETVPVETLGNGLLRTSLKLQKDEITIFDTDALTQVICRTRDGREQIDATILPIIVETMNANVSEGADVTIGCKAETDSEGQNLTWYRNGMRLANSDRYTLEANGTRLVIKDSRPEDAGVYTCNMTLHTTEKSGQTLLQDVMLNGQPYMTKDVSTTVDILLNETLTITCPVAGYPRPVVFWLRDGDTEVKASDRVTLSSYGDVAGARIMIKNLTSSDLGEYTCAAENSIGRMVKEFQVGPVGAAVSERVAGLMNVVFGVLVAFLGMACSDLW